MTNDHTRDCPPTLTDRQVVEFCRKGYMTLESVVPDEINKRTLDYLAQHETHHPNGLLDENWFVEQVICNPKAAGAVRSLLGKDFHLPIQMADHFRKQPLARAQEWHIDGNYKHTHEMNYLQVFYYPQETPPEMGPTDILPGSHFLHHQHRHMGHLDNLRYAVKLSAPAGSIFVTNYLVWHRSGRGTVGMRHLLKYFYWRTAPPTRDWIAEPDFDFSAADYGMDVPTMGEDFRVEAYAAEMFYWLCGMHDRFQNRGGQSWPIHETRRGVPYGFPGP